MTTNNIPIYIGDRVQILDGVYKDVVGTYKGRANGRVLVEAHTMILHIKPTWIKKLGSHDA